MDSMKSDGQRRRSVNEEIKTAYGFSDEQLIREMDDAIAHPDTSPELFAPYNEFQLIMERAEEMMKRAERKDTPRIAGIAGFTGKFPPARHGRKKMARMMLVAAILGVIGVGGLVSVGRGKYQYREVSGKGTTWNNVETSENISSKMEEAYKSINQELKIPVIGMKYIPSGMEFSGVSFIQQGAVLNFDYNGHKIRLSELGSFLENANMHISDRERYEKEYHRILGEEVFLSKNELNNKKVEFGAEIMTDVAYYYLSGIMEEEEFQKVVQGLYFYEK